MQIIFLQILNLSSGFFSLSHSMDFSLMGVHKVSLKQTIFYINGHDLFFCSEMGKEEKCNCSEKRILKTPFKEAVRFTGVGVRLEEIRD